MRQKFKGFFKKIVLTIMCISSVLTAVYSCIPKAYAASTLNTSETLGSPILNSKATTENWNKWEMICWGVFLSNFCQPLIDDYESAFSSASTKGSKGRGFQALCFGTGSDPQNNDVIQNFCSYATKVEKESNLKNIYVAYSHIQNNQIVEAADPKKVNSNGEPVVRTATFDDFFFSDGDNGKAIENTTSMIQGDMDMINYPDSFGIIDAYVPTFYVKNTSTESEYTTILDFSNSWDVQIFSCMINAVNVKSSKDSSGNSLKKAFIEAFQQYRGTETQVGLDCFGNIVTSDRNMIFPSACNQNITTERSINILNSWVLNSYISNYSSQNMIAQLHQTRFDDKDTIFNFIAANIENNNKLFDFSQPFAGKISDAINNSISSFDEEYSGVAAFGSSTITDAGFFYYDMDSIVSDYADKTVNYGEAMIKLFNQDIESFNNVCPLKYEISGEKAMRWVIDWFGSNSDSGEDISLLLGKTALAASVIPNIITSDRNAVQPEVLHEMLDKDGNSIDMFSEKPVIVAVQVEDEEHDEGDKCGVALRNFYNWMYKVYKGEVRETTSGIFNASQLNDIISTVVKAEDLQEKTGSNGGTSGGKTIWEYFTATNPTYAD